MIIDLFKLSFVPVTISAILSATSMAGAIDATHVPARGPDAVAAVGGVANTVAAAGGGLDWDRTAVEESTWRWRSAASIGLIDEGWHETDTAFFGDPADNDAPMLVTTITGLDPGQDYNIYVDYLTDARTTSSGIVNWTLLAGFSPSELTAFGYVDGATMGSYTTVGLGDPRIVSIGDETGAIENYRALLGEMTADGSGEISVYIDDTDNVPDDAITVGSNGRAAYDGLAFEKVPEPSTMVLVSLFASSLLFGRRNLPISLQARCSES